MVAMVVAMAVLRAVAIAVAVVVAAVAAGAAAAVAYVTVASYVVLDDVDAAVGIVVPVAGECRC